MTKIEILSYIKNYADKAHGDQVRKYTGERYIVHPARVMHTVAQYNDQLAVLAAALLHDVLEDTAVTEKEMRAALTRVMETDTVDTTLRLVVELTDVFVKKNYPGMSRRSRKEREIQRLSGVSPEAQSIKYADIIDNVTDIIRDDADFAKVFVREAKGMLSVMEAGDPALRQRALALVAKCLHDMKKEAQSF